MPRVSRRMGSSSGELVGDPLGVVAAVDGLVGHAALQRAGPVEGVEGDEVAELGRHEAAQQVLHARAFELEDPVRVAGPEELERGRVVERQIVDIDGDAGLGPDQGQGVVDDRQVAQAQQVHLEQAQGLDVAHRELGRDLALDRLVEGQELDQRLGRDDDAGGVDRGVADLALDPLGDSQELGDLGVAVAKRLELGHGLERVGDGRVEGEGDHLGDAVDLGQGHLEDAADVADGPPGGHGPEGDDLADVLLAVLLGHVLDHLLPAAAAEVHVDVGQADALGIEEALEEQVVLDRVDLGDLEGVGQEAPGGRTAARADRDALLAGGLEQVPDDEEVALEVHLLDELDLALEPLLVLAQTVRGRPVDHVGLPPGHPGPEALPGHLLEIIAERFACGRGEVGQVVALGRELEGAAGGDLARVLDGVGRVLEELGHFRGGLEIELVGRELEPVRVGDLAVGLDADEDVLALGVVPPGEMDVVRGHQGQAELAGHRHELRVDRLLVGEAVVHELDVEIAGREDPGVLPGRRLGLLGEAAVEPERDLALEAGRQPDEALAVGGQQLLVDPRPVIEALEIALGDELAEVLVAPVVLDQEDEMEVVDLVGRPRLLVEAALGGDVALAAEDGLDPLGLGRLEELDRAEDVAVVGHGHGGHVVLVGGHDEGLDLEAAVEDGIFGMVVEMNEGRFHERYLSRIRRRGPDGLSYSIPTRSSRAAWSSRRRRPG